MNTITNGVTAPMIFETLSTSSMPVTSTKTSMSSAPTHTGHPNCCSRLEPPPANMTKPIANSVTTVAMSSSQDMVLPEMRDSTAVCSLAWK